MYTNWSIKHIISKKYKGCAYMKNKIYKIWRKLICWVLVCFMVISILIAPITVTAGQYNEISPHEIYDDPREDD